MWFRGDQSEELNIIIVHIQVHCIPCQAGCKLVWHAHCKIDIHTSIHFWRCWRGEFVLQSKASLVGDHFLHSLDLTMWFRGDQSEELNIIIVHIQVHCIPCQAGCKLVWHAHCKIEAELILKVCNIFYFCQYTPTQNSWVECQGICLLSYIPKIVKKKNGISKISRTFH